MWFALYSLSESRSSDDQLVAQLAFIGAIIFGIGLCGVSSKIALILNRSGPIDALAFCIPFIAPFALVIIGGGANLASVFIWIGVVAGAAIVAFGFEYLIRTRNEND
jgi:hypothetical protein